jgi:hypothetical protein
MAEAYHFPKRNKSSCWLSPKLLEDVIEGETLIVLSNFFDAATKQSLGSIDGFVCDLSSDVNNKTQEKFYAKPVE